MNQPKRNKIKKKENLMRRLAVVTGSNYHMPSPHECKPKTSQTEIAIKRLTML